MRAGARGLKRVLFSPFFRRSVLSRCCHAVLALLYPFTWQHTFIPVLPASMLDVSCSPTPFLIGVLAPCLPQLLELPIEEVSLHRTPHIPETIPHAHIDGSGAGFWSRNRRSVTISPAPVSYFQVLIVDLCADKFVVQVCTHFSV